MLGLNGKVIAAAAVILALMGGVIWWQYHHIGQLNEKNGQLTAQNAQLGADLEAQYQQTVTLIDVRKREQEIREANDRKKDATIRRLKADADAWRRAIQADPDARVWLDSALPDGINQRLCALFPDKDRGPLCGPVAGHGQKPGPAGVQRGNG